MVNIGDRIRLTSNKGADREGVVTGITGSMLRVRWAPDEETTVVPGPGTLTVLGRTAGTASRPAKKAAASKKATGTRTLVTKKAASKKALSKKGGTTTRASAGKKLAPEKAPPTKSTGTTNKAATTKKAAATKRVPPRSAAKKQR
jgi:hypothetical protein